MACISRANGPDEPTVINMMADGGADDENQHGSESFGGESGQSVSQNDCMALGHVLG